MNNQNTTEILDSMNGVIAELDALEMQADKNLQELDDLLKYIESLESALNI